MIGVDLYVFDDEITIADGFSPIAQREMPLLCHPSGKNYSFYFNVLCHNWCRCISFHDKKSIADYSCSVIKLIEILLFTIQ